MEPLHKQNAVMEGDTEDSIEQTVLSWSKDSLVWISISAALIFVGLCCLLFLCLRRHFLRKRKTKPALNLSSPPLRRRFSEHPFYPPTPPISPHPLAFSGHSSLDPTASSDTLPECELDSAGVQAVLAARSANDQNVPVREAEMSQSGASHPECESVSIAMPEQVQPEDDASGKESQQTPCTAEPKCEQTVTRCLSASELSLKTEQDRSTLSRNL